MPKIYIGDSGVVLTVDTRINIADATVREIKLKDPKGQVSSLEDEGTDSTKIRVTLPELTEAGDYLLQAYVELSNGDTHYGETTSFTVSELWS